MNQQGPVFGFRRSAPLLAGAALLVVLSGISRVAQAETDQEYCERQEGPAKTVCLRNLNAKKAPPAAPAGPDAMVPAGQLYKVVDGFHVDPGTLKGFQTWRSAACDRCHGPNQEGLVGPSLIEGLKTLSKDEFVKTVTNGRLEKGMPSFSTNPAVMANINLLYAYLKGRSDGAITKAHVQPIE